MHFFICRESSLNNMVKYFCLLFSLTLTTSVFSQSTSLTFNPKTRFQKIEGFGGAIFYYGDWISSNPNSDKIYDYLFKNLGTTILRLGNEYMNEGGDNPGLATSAKIVAEANKRTPTDLLLSTWSPPAAYKCNHDTRNHDTKATLDSNKKGEFVYGDYAKWWYNSILQYDYRGMPIKYLSIQNEPNWGPGYEGCIFMPKEQVIYDDTLKRKVRVASYGEAFSRVFDTIYKYKSHLTIMPKFLGPEVFGIEKKWGPNITDYTQNMDLSKCYGINHHLYTGGSSKNANSYIGNLKYLHESYPTKPLFQTEYSEGDWLFTAQLIQNSLLVEQASSYILWTYAWPNSEGALISTENPSDKSHWQTKTGYKVTLKYYAVKQFTNFIKPNWQMIDITPSDTTLSASAFINPNNDSVSVVLINNSNERRSIKLNPSYFSISSGKMYRTSMNDSCVLIGNFNKDSITLLPKSILTISLKGKVSKNNNASNAINMHTIFDKPRSLIRPISKIKVLG